jgi:hypothetical protein
MRTHPQGAERATDNFNRCGSFLREELTKLVRESLSHDFELTRAASKLFSQLEKVPASQIRDPCLIFSLQLLQEQSASRTRIAGFLADLAARFGLYSSFLPIGRVEADDAGQVGFILDELSQIARIGSAGGARLVQQPASYTVYRQDVPLLQSGHNQSMRHLSSTALAPQTYQRGALPANSSEYQPVAQRSVSPYPAPYSEKFIGQQRAFSPNIFRPEERTEPRFPVTYEANLRPSPTLTDNKTIYQHSPSTPLIAMKSENPNFQISQTISRNPYVTLERETNAEARPLRDPSPIGSRNPKPVASPGSGHGLGDSPNDSRPKRKSYLGSNSRPQSRSSSVATDAKEVIPLIRNFGQKRGIFLGPGHIPPELVKLYSACTPERIDFTGKPSKICAAKKGRTLLYGSDQLGVVSRNNYWFVDKGVALPNLPFCLVKAYEDGTVILNDFKTWDLIVLDSDLNEKGRLKGEGSGPPLYYKSFSVTALYHKQLLLWPNSPSSICVVKVPDFTSVQIKNFWYYKNLVVQPYALAMNSAGDLIFGLGELDDVIQTLHCYNNKDFVTVYELNSVFKKGSGRSPS